MNIFTKKVSVIASGNGYSITIPQVFAKDLKIKKGEKLLIVYDPERKTLAISR